MRWQQLRQTVQASLSRLLYGRNGPDQLSLAALLLSVLFSLAARLSGRAWLLLPGYLLLAVCFFRILSRNVSRRRAENARFVARLRPLQGWWRLRRRMLRERHTHRYLKCPACGLRLRVPRGRGAIRITCTQCRHAFTKKV